MKVYQFSWCVCSFDQECNVEASSKEKAIEIFSKKNKFVWKNNEPSISCLNKTYTKDWIKKNIKIHYSE